MSRITYLDNSKKSLIFMKGSLQKELEDFGLNTAVVPTHVTSKQPNRTHLSVRREADPHTKLYSAVAQEPSASFALARSTSASPGLEQGVC